MEISENIKEMLLNADGKALATLGEKGLNVVPVSSIKVKDNKIILVNYFFGKTLQNIKENKDIALTAWKDLEGFQIKAEAEYQEEGELFEEVTQWIKETLPDRIVKGILVLTPTEVFDISAGPDAGAKVV